jgi:hypothetical protein
VIRTENLYFETQRSREGRQARDSEGGNSGTMIAKP